MRYWVNGEDEDYDRELDRVRRYGGEEPAQTSRSFVVLVVAIGVAQMFLIGLLVVDYWTR